MQKLLNLLFFVPQTSMGPPSLDLATLAEPYHFSYLAGAILWFLQLSEEKITCCHVTASGVGLLFRGVGEG